MEKMYTKLELAEIQLSRALDLYLDHQDYVSALTLAGAAEELLGKWYAHKVKQDADTRDISLRNEVDVGRVLHKRLWGTEVSEKEVVSRSNFARDQVKHFGEGLSLCLNFEVECRYLIERAAHNYLLCTGNYPSRIAKFDEGRPERDPES